MAGVVGIVLAGGVAPDCCWAGRLGLLAGGVFVGGWLPPSSSVGVSDGVTNFLDFLAGGGVVADGDGLGVVLFWILGFCGLVGVWKMALGSKSEFTGFF